MRNSSRTPETQIPAEATRELNIDNIKAIDRWLNYLNAFAKAKKAAAEPMQTDLLKKYAESWSKILPNPKLSQEQKDEIQDVVEAWHEKETQKKAISKYKCWVRESVYIILLIL
jgi:hypothetical protein